MINADYCELAVCKGDTFNFRSPPSATGLYPWSDGKNESFIGTPIIVLIAYSYLYVGTPHMESNHLFQFTTGEELHSSLRDSGDGLISPIEGITS